METVCSQLSLCDIHKTEIIFAVIAFIISVALSAFAGHQWAEKKRLNVLMPWCFSVLTGGMALHILFGGTLLLFAVPLMSTLCTGVFAFCFASDKTKQLCSTE